MADDDAQSDVLTEASPFAPTATGAPPAGQASDTTGGLGARPGVTPAGIGALLVGALLPTAFSAQTLSSSFTPKYLVLLVVAGFGALPLLKLARSSHISLAAKGAVVFLVIALVSALTSQAVNIGIFGLYAWGTGWLFWLGCAGAFAIGARLTAGDLNWACAGIVLGAVGNAVTAVYQIVSSPGGALALYNSSQADGLLGNPIHLEAILLGALALIAGRASVSKERMAWWPVVMLLSVALEFTLERVGVLLMIVVILGALVAYGWKRAAPFGLFTLAGWAIGYLAGGSGLGKRVTSGTTETTFGTRLRIWDLALKSTLHHPLLGVGPGELVSGVAPRMTETFARDLGPGTLPVDSHNFVIEVLATTGVLGLLAFLTWVGGAALKARGPFLAFTIMALSVELIEPLNIGVTPVALLALGAATASVGGQPVGLRALEHWRVRNRPVPSDGSASPGVWASGDDTIGDSGAQVAASGAGEAGAAAAGAETAAAEGSPGRAGHISLPALVATLVLVVGALFLGGTMVVGDHDLLGEYVDFLPAPKLAASLDANRLLPYWPQSASAVAGAYQWQSELAHAPGALGKAQPYVQRAVNRDRAEPELWADAGDLQLLLGDRPGARQFYLQSLRRDPWTVQALIGLGTIAQDEHQWAASAHWFEMAAAVSPPSTSLAHDISSDLAHLKGG